MIRFLNLLTINSSLEIRELLLNRVQCPFMTCNRICMGYLNGDLVMVFSGIITLVLSIAFLLASFNKGGSS